MIHGVLGVVHRVCILGLVVIAVIVIVSVSLSVLDFTASVLPSRIVSSIRTVVVVILMSALLFEVLGVVVLFAQGLWEGVHISARSMEII